MKRHKYLYDSPRGLANEYNIYKIASDQKEKAMALLDKSASDPNHKTYWISFRQARSLIAMNKKGYRLGTCNYQNPCGATEYSNIDILFD